MPSTELGDAQLSCGVWAPSTRLSHFLAISLLFYSRHPPQGGFWEAESGVSPLLSVDSEDDHSEGGLVENHVDGTMNMLGGSSAGRKPPKSGMKELAVFREKVNEQHRQMGKGAKHLSLEEPKKLRPPPARVSGGLGSTGGGRRVWEGSLAPVKNITLCPICRATNKQTESNIFDDLWSTGHYNGLNMVS